MRLLTTLAIAAVFALGGITGCGGGDKDAAKKDAAKKDTAKKDADAKMS